MEEKVYMSSISHTPLSPDGFTAVNTTVHKSQDEPREFDVESEIQVVSRHGAVTLDFSLFGWIRETHEVEDVAAHLESVVHSKQELDQFLGAVGRWGSQTMDLLQQSREWAASQGSSTS